MTEPAEKALMNRTDFIASVMEKQGGCHKVPRKYVVLQRWNEIVDHDATFEVKTPPIPAVCKPGERYYAMANPDNPELTLVQVVEDRGQDGLFVQPVKAKHKTQFLVYQDQLRVLPIPLRPRAVLRSDLGVYLGDEAAKVWHAHRRERRGAGTAQE